MGISHHAGLSTTYSIPSNLDSAHPLGWYNIGISLPEIALHMHKTTAGAATTMSRASEGA
jgi:hypothetical protein